MAAIVVNRPCTADEFSKTISMFRPSSQIEQPNDPPVAINDVDAESGTERYTNLRYGNRDKWKSSRQSPHQHTRISSRETNPTGRDGWMMKCDFCKSEEHIHATCPTRKYTKRYVNSFEIQPPSSSDDEDIQPPKDNEKKPELIYFDANDIDVNNFVMNILVKRSALHATMRDLPRNDNSVAFLGIKVYSGASGSVYCVKQLRTYYRFTDTPPPQVRKGSIIVRQCFKVVWEMRNACRKHGDDCLRTFRLFAICHLILIRQIQSISTRSSKGMRTYPHARRCKRH